MLEFENKKEQFPEIRKQILIKRLPLLIVCSIVGIGAATYEKYEAYSLMISIISTCFSVIFATSIFTWLLRKQIRKEKLIFESFKLTLDENRIIKEQSDSPKVIFTFDKIKSITKKPNGSIVIVNKDASELIEISQYINDFDILEHRLGKIMEIGH